MENKINLFEGAKFGDKYWTQPEDGFPMGRMALFSRFGVDDDTKEVFAILYLNESFAEIFCTLDGKYFDYIGADKRFWDDIPQPYIAEKYKQKKNERRF